MSRILRIVAGSGLLAGASLLALPEQATAWTTIGGSLGITQRDFRLHNGFTGSNANNNTVQDANFPGYDGAELAMWKAGIEWNARAHGDGSGDPLQSELGSGGANFNFFWNGNASGNGSTNDNIVGTIGGSSGGVLAYMQGPISNGWEIKFYASAWNWEDGPGGVSGIDIQGVGCHELGHALGLGHSSTSSATMYAFIQGSGTNERSLHSDDIAGVKAIYGSRDDNAMPRVDTVSGSLVPGGTVVITGNKFSTSGNRIWLNRDVLDQGSLGGEALKVSNVSSTGGGTQLSFTLPQSGWESGGSIHVQSSANDNKSLSESHPFDAGPLPTDTVVLTASNIVPHPGNWIDFTIQDVHPNSPWIIHYALSNNGWINNGQPFTISPPNGQVGSGNLNVIGVGNFSRRVPQAGHLLTVYMEAEVLSGGQTYDSNMITMFIQ